MGEVVNLWVRRKEREREDMGRHHVLVCGECGHEVFVVRDYGKSVTATCAVCDLLALTLWGA